MSTPTGHLVPPLTLQGFVDVQILALLCCFRARPLTVDEVRETFNAYSFRVPGPTSSYMGPPILNTLFYWSLNTLNPQILSAQHQMYATILERNFRRALYKKLMQSSSHEFSLPQLYAAIIVPIRILNHLILDLQRIVKLPDSSPFQKESTAEKDSKEPVKDKESSTVSLSIDEINKIASELAEMEGPLVKSNYTYEVKYNDSRLNKDDQKTKLKHEISNQKTSSNAKKKNPDQVSKTLDAVLHGAKSTIGRKISKSFTSKMTKVLKATTSKPRKSEIDTKETYLHQTTTFRQPLKDEK